MKLVRIHINDFEKERQFEPGRENQRLGTWTGPVRLQYPESKAQDVVKTGNDTQEGELCYKPKEGTPEVEITGEKKPEKRRFIKNRGKQAANPTSAI